METLKNLSFYANLSRPVTNAGTTQLFPIQSLPTYLVTCPLTYLYVVCPNLLFSIKSTKC